MNGNATRRRYTNHSNKNTNKKQTDRTEKSKIQRNIERSGTETNKQTQFPNESIEKTK